MIGGRGNDALHLIGGSFATTTHNHTNANDGSIVLDPDGPGGLDASTISYTGLETITIHGANDPPVANDDAYDTTKDTPLVVPAASGLLANDTDPDVSDVRTVSGVDTTGTRGQVTWNADGSFTYNPNGKFAALGVGETATDTFSYTVKDAWGHGRGHRQDHCSRRDLARHGGCTQ